jgi:hypothetical protein
MRDQEKPVPAKAGMQTGLFRINRPADKDLERATELDRISA